MLRFPMESAIRSRKGNDIMPPIYPSTALKNRQREIKDLADTQMVYITENGRGKYIFASEQVVEER